MGKWIVFAVAVAAALFAFLVYRRKATAAVGTSPTTGAPAGATAAGMLATLTAPARPDDTNAQPIGLGWNTPNPYAYVSGGRSAGMAEIYAGLSAPVIPVTASLPVVGYGTVAPSKPSTQALPTAYNPQTVWSGFESSSLYKAPAPTTTTTTTTAPTSYTAPKLTFATRL